MRLNAALIKKRCEEIADSLKRLEKIKAADKDRFLKDRDLQDIASYRLLIAIEAALSLCYHVSAKELQKVPGEYAECFLILAEAKIIPRDLSEELKKMTRFRNMLVHMYWKIDYEIVFDILQENLDNLRQFSEAIAALLKTEDKEDKQVTDDQ
ncbi:MAG: DUF86 domain-containing protein [Candidatus Aminicenantes bacterium]|nr:MAG: DUF86 domain-containing protein [Candidatus Aminicenantes bacterium]